MRTSTASPGAPSVQDATPNQLTPTDAYKYALDEYRFQVNLNWSRSQYYIVLNLGIVGLATGLLRVDDQNLAAGVGIGLYLVGAVCSVLTLFAVHVQQGYYRQARDHKARLEEKLGAADLAIRTTQGMGNTTRRLAKVTTFQNVILSMLLALDLAGLGYSTFSLLEGDDPSSPQCVEMRDQKSSAVVQLCTGSLRGGLSEH